MFGTDKQTEKQTKAKTLPSPTKLAVVEDFQTILKTII